MAAFPNPFRALVPVRPSSNGPALAGAGSRYLQGGSTNPLGMWTPVLREPQADTHEAWYRAASQAVETLHNSGFISSAVKSARGQMINPDGLRLNLKPWGGIIFSDPKLQAAWARDVEGRFHVWASNPWQIDWGARYELGQLLGQGCDQYFAFGENVATLPYDKDRPGTSHGTKVNLMPASRLTQASGIREHTIQGVTMDPLSGRPLGYTFQHFDQLRGQSVDQYVLARDSRGRQAALHLLDNGPGAVRGITPLAPALKIIRQYDQLQDGTLVAALLQTVFAATVESEAPTEDMMRALQGMDEQDDEVAAERTRLAAGEMEGVPLGSFMDLMTARASWYKSTNIDLGRFGKIAHLFPGEKLTFNKVQHADSNYQAMCKMLQAEIARCLGVATYQVTGIFDGFTYTTAKMAVDEAWPMVLWRRAHISARMCQAIFEAWLEEDILRGFTVIPGGIAQFYAQRDLICRADWRGPPRPTADDLKTAKANQVLRAEGWASTEGIAAGYGEDWVEVADSQSASDEYRRDKDLPPVPMIGGGGNGAGSAAVAGGNPLGGGRRDPNAQSQEAIDREARLVGAMMRGDNDELPEILMEFPNVQRHFPNGLDA